MAKILIGKYEGTIYPEGNGFTGAISLGFGPDGKRKRLKRKGRTKTEVQDKLIKAVADLTSGIQSPEHYTVKNAVDDWLDGLTGKLSTRTLRTVHAILKRSIRQAQARDLVLRNVAELVTPPKGQPGRPSKALTQEQAQAVLDRARRSRLYAYIALSLMTGIRTEEARKLRWDHVVAWVDEDGRWQPVTKAGFDHKRFAVYIWRSVRATGDTKTKKSRRTLELPEEVVRALRKHHRRQAKDKLKAGARWQENGLVFCTKFGTPLDASSVRRTFRTIATKAGVGSQWSPRELRHSFVSIMSDQGVPIETIADICGHAGTAVTEAVYRHQLKPVIRTGPEHMNSFFGSSQSA